MPVKSKPTTTYAEVMDQIEQLQAKAEALKQAEVDDVIARIKEAVRMYDLTAADLGLGGVLRRGPRAKTQPVRAGRRKGAAVKSKAPKFRDEAGNVWVGRGPRPTWLREALASGKKLEDFAV